MGSCVSASIEAKNPNRNGTDMKHDCRGRNVLSGASSKVSDTLRAEEEILQSSNIKRFSFDELKNATMNFNTDIILGEGRYGSVYKGWIDEQTLTAAKPGTGLVVAVKLLKREHVPDHEKWLTEIRYQGQLDHPNIVKLIGYCLEDDRRLLVHEFVTRGSLENHLFRKSSCFQPLSWNIRVKIALGAARALAFLHTDQINVIYRNIKTANILIDSDYNAKFHEFGLAKTGPTDGRTHVSTSVLSSSGYSDPDYMATGRLTAKSDVYSFGVILLELLIGRRATDRNMPYEEHNLVEWAMPNLANKHTIFQILDGRIKGQYKLEETLKVAKVAMQCLSTEAKFRPNMEQVLRELSKVQDPKSTGGSNHNTN